MVDHVPPRIPVGRYVSAYAGGEAPHLSLAEFIKHRQSQLETQEQKLRKQLADIREERDQLRRAAMAAGIVVVPPAETKGSGSEEIGAKRTLKDNILECLKDFPNGISANDLLTVVNARFNTTYANTSVSPELTRLKAREFVRLTGKLWHLPEYDLENQEASDPELFEGEGSDADLANTHPQGREGGPGGGT